MSFTQWLKESVENARETMTTEITKFKSKDLLEAIVSGCAMVSYADGGVSSTEKQKMMGFLKTSDQLKVFDQNDVIQLFQKYAEKFEFDNTIGTGETMAAIGRFKGKPEAQLIVRVCCAIGASDGNFDQQEQDVVRGMVNELGLDASTFGL